MKIKRYPFVDQVGIPFVTLDCAYNQLLSNHIAAVVISGEFQDREYKLAETSELISGYQARTRGLVVFTTGDGAVLYGRKDSTLKHFKPFPVVADNTGAGDSFRAGVAYIYTPPGLILKFPVNPMRASSFSCKLGQRCKAFS